MNRGRPLDVAAVVLSVAVIVGLSVALRPAATATVTTNPSSVEIDRPEVAEPGTRPLVLFIGDSYTAGNGLAEMSYGCMAANRMGWLCKLSAVPGTGYISDGAADRSDVPYEGPSKSFVERIPYLAAAYQPDVVVLDGGRNDRSPVPDRVFKAMVGTITEVRRAWPNAKIVFVRPRFLAEPGDDAGFSDAFIANLRRQPEAKGVIFIDPIHMLTGMDTSRMLRDDRIHPNQRGNDEIRSALFRALSTHGFASST
jgi:lysophospholipase L1-like esterase